jgi:integrase
MARPKKQIKLKEPIKIRLKSLSDGNKSIYLDIYYKGVRKYEYLKLYIIPEVNPICKQQNAETMALAEQIKAERIKALSNHDIKDWECVKKGAMLLTNWIKKYCEGGVGVKKSTLHCRVEMLHTIEKYIDECDKTFITLEEVNADFCRGYAKFLRSFPNSHIKYSQPRPISQNTSSRYLGMFSTALNNAVRQGIIRKNPMSELDAKERIQPKEGSKQYLTIEELRKLMVTDCYRPEVKQAFIFACFTGLRLSDMYRLAPMHIFKSSDGKSEYIDMEMQKTERPVIIPLSEEAKRWLPETKGRDIPFFEIPTTATVIGRALRKWAEAAGIDKHISFHVSRHTFGTMMITLGADLFTTSKLMGHTNIHTTEIYAKIVDKKKEQAINLIDGMFK